MWAAEVILTKDIDCGTHKDLFNKDIHTIARAGEKVTITKGVKSDYAVWHTGGIMDTPKEYIDEKTIKVICAE